MLSWVKGRVIRSGFYFRSEIPSRCFWTWGLLNEDTDKGVAFRCRRGGP